MHFIVLLNDNEETVLVKRADVLLANYVHLIR